MLKIHVPVITQGFLQHEVVNCELPNSK